MKRISTIIACILIAICSIHAQEQAKPTITTLTKEQFIEKVWDYTGDSGKEWKYKGDKPAIIDFYADWCGPCRKLSPILEEIATEQKGKLVIYKINVDKERELAGIFGIRSLPTLLFIPVEGAPSSFVGYAEKAELYKAINEQLLKEKEEE